MPSHVPFSQFVNLTIDRWYFKIYYGWQLSTAGHRNRRHRPLGSMAMLTPGHCSISSAIVSWLGGQLPRLGHRNTGAGHHVLRKIKVTENHRDRACAEATARGSFRTLLFLNAKVDRPGFCSLFPHNTPMDRSIGCTAVVWPRCTRDSVSCVRLGVPSQASGS